MSGDSGHPCPVTPDTHVRSTTPGSLSLVSSSCTVGDLRPAWAWRDELEAEADEGGTTDSTPERRGSDADREEPSLFDSAVDRVRELGNG